MVPLGRGRPQGVRGTGSKCSGATEFANRSHACAVRSIPERPGLRQTPRAAIGATKHNLITISFATRNINLSRETLVKSFVEFRRVLRPGGRFVNLETSQPPFAPMRRCSHWYARVWVKRMGSQISGSRKGYAYLAETMSRFYSPEALADILRQAGFKEIAFKPLFFGVAAIHRATKEG
jgi:ubiquinone/menaquinone biosynthesis C-methylase UbiE